MLFFLLLEWFTKWHLPSASLNGQLEAQSRPFRAEQAELSYGCGKELVAPFRSEESPSFTKEFFNEGAQNHSSPSTQLRKQF